MTSATNSLIEKLNTESGNIDIIGYIVWWNVREVKVTRDWFKSKLDQIGIDGEKYAKEHNYRATFIRALKHLEEQRIIRKVTEDPSRLIYQFTSEILVDDDESPRLDYVPETTIEINKSVYFSTESFSESITKCDENLKQILIDKFNEEKINYKSSDITRYVQKIFGDQADLVSLRPQGSVYFVPASYKALIKNIANILAEVPQGTASLEYFPVPDVESSRKAVGQGVEDEISYALTKIEEDVALLTSNDDEITDKWVQTRLDRVNKLKERVNMYADILGDTNKHLNKKFDTLTAALKPRKIEL